MRLRPVFASQFVIDTRLIAIRARHVTPIPHIFGEKIEWVGNFEQK